MAEGFLGAQLSGLTPQNIVSPLKSVVGSDVHLDNAHSRFLSVGFTSADIATDLFNGFNVPKLMADLIMPVPSGAQEDRVVRFTFIQGAIPRSVTWPIGVSGYLFASGAAAVGVTQAQFDTLLAAMTENQMMLIGFSYKLSFDAYVALSLAGPFLV